MLYPKVSLEDLLMFDIGNRLAIKPCPNPRSFRSHPEMIPFLGFKQTVDLFAINRLILARRVKPAPGTDTIDSGRFIAVNLALISPWLAFRADTAKSQSGIKPRLGRQQHFQLCLKVAHLHISSYPTVGFRQQLQFTFLGLEGNHLTTWRPPLSRLAIKKVYPVASS